jgi:hypothetical protein
MNGSTLFVLCYTKLDRRRSLPWRRPFLSSGFGQLDGQVVPEHWGYFHLVSIPYSFCSNLLLTNIFRMREIVNAVQPVSFWAIGRVDDCFQ